MFLQIVHLIYKFLIRQTQYCTYSTILKVEILLCQAAQRQSVIFSYGLRKENIFLRLLLHCKKP